MARRAFFWVTLLAFAGDGVVNLQAALDYPYQYNFISSDPGVSGKLFLDQSSSSSGSAADIGPGSYLTFNLYNGYLPPVTFDLSSLNTSLDSSFTFAWTASQITTPLDLAVGSGRNDVLLNREFQHPNNQSPFAPEYDAIEYACIYLGANQNLLNGQVLSSSIVSLVASEATLGVGGGGVVYNIPFDPATAGRWIAAVAVPEPAQIALFTACGALALVVLMGGKRPEGCLKTLLSSRAGRIPPSRD